MNVPACWIGMLVLNSKDFSVRLLNYIIIDVMKKIERVETVRPANEIKLGIMLFRVSVSLRTIHFTLLFY